MFRILFTDTEIKIKIKSMFGRTIKTNVGSPQGDLASVILFILYLSSRIQKYKIDVDKDDLYIEIQYADALGWASSRKNTLKGQRKYSKHIKRLQHIKDLEINLVKCRGTDIPAQRRRQMENYERPRNATGYGS